MSHNRNGLCLRAVQFIAQEIIVLGVLVLLLLLGATQANEASIVVSFAQREIPIDTTQPLEIKMMDSGRTHWQRGSMLVSD